MKRTLIISAFFIILLSALLFFQPYNLFHYFNAEKKVESLLSDPTVRDAALGEDSEIVDVHYLGSHMYRVQTEDSTYVLEIQTSSDSSKQTVEVFEHRQNINQLGSR